MPLIRNGSLDQRKLDELTHQLAAELAAPRAAGQPTILENRIGQTQKYNVSVLWDDWADLPMQARARVILDAYQRAVPDRAADVAVALGLTARDAVRMGWFPYTVVPGVDDPVTDLWARLKEASIVEKLTAGELRFPTLERAKAARDRLRLAIPDAAWVVVVERRPDEGSQPEDGVFHVYVTS